MKYKSVQKLIHEIHKVEPIVEIEQQYAQIAVHLLQPDEAWMTQEK